jgi:hypothetical protein
MVDAVGEELRLIASNKKIALVTKSNMQTIIPAPKKYFWPPGISIKLLYHKQST